MQTILFAGSLLLSSGGRVQRTQHVGSVEENVASEVSANTTYGNDKCYADQSSLLHLFAQAFQRISPSNLVFPLYGVSTPPLYKVGECEFSAQAGIALVLEGVGNIQMDYKCAYPGSNTDAVCENVWCGKKCRYPMDTTIKFNSPIGLRIQAGANLKACGLSTGNLKYLNQSIGTIGVGGSVQITDIDMRTFDQFDCTQLVYQGFRGQPEVRGGQISWNGLHCVIGGLALLGLQMTDTFQQHCTNFLNMLFSKAVNGLKDAIALTVAEDRPSV
jgi:hypothetical protein